jgi:hypothetical protein
MWPLDRGLLGDREQHDAGEGPDLVGLAETIGKSISAGAVFGPPVSRGRTTVIPVAKARYGLGGGRMPWSKGGSGAGGNMRVAPAGYLLLRGSRARYQPIGHAAVPMATVALGFAAAMVGMMLPMLLSANGFNRAANPPV